MSGNPQRKKRKMQYFRSQHKSKRSKMGPGFGVLAAGQRGFIVTCNKREREAAREVVHLLEEALRRIMPEEEEEEEVQKNEEEQEEEEDLEAAMRKEAEEEISESKFQPASTGVSNTVFVISSVTERSPTALANEVFTELISRRRGQPRSALRCLPVEAVLRADDREGIRRRCSELWAEFAAHKSVKLGDKVAGGALTYAVDYRARNLSPGEHLIDKDAAVSAWVDAVRAANPECKVSLIRPDIVLGVNVLRKCVCLSLLEFNDEFAKYNLQGVLAATVNDQRQNEEEEGNRDGEEEGSKENEDGGESGEGKKPGENGEGVKE